MNLPVWKQELARAGLLPKLNNILHGLAHGFDQGIKRAYVSDAPFFCPPNHSSALAAKEKIEESFRVELAAGRMEGPFSKEEVLRCFGFFRTSPLGAVVNGNGSTRPINDLSFPKKDPYVRSVNADVDKTDFETTWDDFNVVARFLGCTKEAVELAIYDWAKAYRQIPTSPDQWRFLMLLTFDNQIMLDKRITFGGVAGCGSFGQVADAWKAVVLSRFPLLTAFRWVDDTMFVRKKQPSPLVSLDDISALSARMGIVENIEKRHDFADEQQYLGFIWNGTEKTVRLPDKKITERHNEVVGFLKRKSHTFKEVERLAGRLTHTSMILPHLKCNCVDIYHWMAEWHNRLAKREIPEGVRHDLLVWEKTLIVPCPRRTIPKPEILNVNWVGDASTSYGIGIIVGRRWSRFRLRSGWSTTEANGEKRGIAWAETVATRLGFIMLMSIYEVKGKRFLMLTDNTVTEGAIRNGKSRDRMVNREWSTLQDLLMLNHSCIEAKRVRSEDNAADKLSRGFDSSKRASDRVWIHVPEDLKRFVQQE